MIASIIASPSPYEVLPHGLVRLVHVDLAGAYFEFPKLKISVGLVVSSTDAVELLYLPHGLFVASLELAYHLILLNQKGLRNFLVLAVPERLLKPLPHQTLGQANVDQLWDVQEVGSLVDLLQLKQS